MCASALTLTRAAGLIADVRRIQNHQMSEKSRKFIVFCLLAGTLGPVCGSDQPQPDSSNSTQTAAETAESLWKVEIRDVITSWASAWQSQMNDLYLLHYSPAFEPEGFTTIALWEAARRARLQDPEHIDISLRGLEFVTLEETRARIRFWLKYARPGYADETRKEMLLEKSSGVWRIRSEHNMQVRRLAAPG